MGTRNSNRIFLGVFNLSKVLFLEPHKSPFSNICRSASNASLNMSPAYLAVHATDDRDGTILSSTTGSPL